MHIECYSPDYLQACALVGERRAKETCDDAHDRLRYIALQDGVCMLSVTGVVANLEEEKICERDAQRPAGGRPLTLPAVFTLSPKHRAGRSDVPSASTDRMA